MKITYHGHSAFRSRPATSVILVDPFFTGNPAARRHLAASLKGAAPMFSSPTAMATIPGDALDILKSTGAVLVSNFEICTWLNGKGVENYSPGNHGGRISFDDFDVIFTNAWHSSSDTVDRHASLSRQPVRLHHRAEGGDGQDALHRRRHRSVLRHEADP